MNRWKSNKGFTLLEVLLVIIIIAILLSLLVPQFGGIKNKVIAGEAYRQLSVFETVERSFHLENDRFASMAELITEKLIPQDPGTVAGAHYSYTITAGTSSCTIVASPDDADGITVTMVLNEDGSKTITP